MNDPTDGDAPDYLSEQLRRARGVWSNEEHSRSELLALRARFRGAPAPRGRPLWPRLAIPLLLGTGTAVAGLGGYRAIVGAPSEPSSGEVSERETASAPRRRVPEGAAKIDRAVTTGDSESDGAPSEDASEEFAGETPSGETVRGSKRPASPPGGGAWREAAEALRANDVRGAEAAFLRLEQGGDSATRERARLARAELYLKSGDGARARPILERLASGATNPTVRARAAKLVERP